METSPLKFLFAATPIAGHFNPLLSIAYTLKAEGHEIRFLTGTTMRERVERFGIAFEPMTGEADIDYSVLEKAFPERSTHPAGPERLLFDLKHAFGDLIDSQFENVRKALKVFPADVVLTDPLFLGTLPVTLTPRSQRPIVIGCGISVLLCGREDGGPMGLGLPPAKTEEERLQYAAIAASAEAQIFDPARAHLNKRLAGLGCPPLSAGIFESVTRLPDAYLQLTVDSFEFPIVPDLDTVRFAGTPPIIPNQAPVPSWAGDLDGSKRVILVSQGTAANDDFGQLVAPTLAALADMPDTLVVATCGGRSPDSIPGRIPDNARVASYLPMEWMLPLTDVFVTNGGYGGVSQALSFGVPMVTAGISEDKADIGARVAWSGVGIDLRTAEPCMEAVRDAVNRVLTEPGYRASARRMSERLRAKNLRDEVLDVVRRLEGDGAELERPAA